MQKDISVKTATFLKQSMEDAWNNYVYGIESSKFQQWDWIIITASNPIQAQNYEKQIQSRLQEKRLPTNTKYMVVTDPEGKRIGSGGATLNVLKCIAEKEGLDTEIQDKRVLVLHSGGDSKRIPQYSACGKLFAPVPRYLPNGKKSTLFDEIIILSSSISNRVESGMLILAGDIQVIYNASQLDLNNVEAAAISVKESVFKGINHGVFVEGEDGKVSKFLHKQTEEILRREGAVNRDNNVDIDTGMIWLGKPLVSKMMELISTKGRVDSTKCEQFINDTVRLSFYGDFLYPLSTEATLAQYLQEKPEGQFSKELEYCRMKIWEALSAFNLTLFRMSPAKFIHFGTTAEVLEMMTKDLGNYDFLNWEKQISALNFKDKKGSIYNSVIENDAQISEWSYIEDSYVGENVSLGKNSILSNVKVRNIQIPENIVLHGLKLQDGKYVVRILGIKDNPNQSLDGMFLGTTLRKFLDYAEISHREVWENEVNDLWSAKIYPVAETLEEAVNFALIIEKISKNTHDKQELENWKKSKKLSLKESFNFADTDYIYHWQLALENDIKVKRIIQLMETKADLALAIEEIDLGAGLDDQMALLLKEEDRVDEFVKMRIYLMISEICKLTGKTIRNHNSEYYEDQAYEVVKQAIVSSVESKFSQNEVKFIKDSVEVKLPVRVNFCGSPSDAAPYCLENGGTMLNAALKLRGELPIVVKIEKIDKKEIQFISVDQKISRTYSNLEELQDCSNLHDEFGLHKAVLLATGVIPLRRTAVTLEDVLSGLGGGISLTTHVDVPKGSGLGTSSIILAAAIKATNAILGQPTDDERIYAQVFSAEQIMNTGGGWQDQVGGLNGGIKYIRSNPGIFQRLQIENVKLEVAIKEELQERFVLIFSGQRRLARNVLREEMNQCIRRNEKTIEIMERIQKICALMKFELERGNISGFGHYLTEQFDLVKQLDKGASNTCIEYIFSVCEDLIEGKSICGAGGGGFLQVILKPGVTKWDLKKRLETVFQGCGIDVWDCELLE